MHNILIGVTGSVAAIKVPKLVEALKPFGDIQIVATKAGKYFLDQANEYSYSIGGGVQSNLNVHVHLDQDEWPNKYELGDPILHIELRRWASCLVLAPLDANTMAKIVHGFSDNLLTSVVRAWDWTKPMFLCPSMNTEMWNNPPTADHITEMVARGAHIIDPVAKKLACGDTGIGAMAPIEEITKRVNEKLRWYFPLQNCNGIPINHHPGAFGFHRRKNHHTGIDLYCKKHSPVYAVEDGVIVHIAQFTGSEVGHNWWMDTWGIMVEGSSGVVNYGEVEDPSVPKWNEDHWSLVKKVGEVVKRGELIGYVKQVLFDEKHRPDIPGHSCSMLHFELYKTGSREFADWHDPQKNPNLLDPTPYLMMAEHGPKKTLTWDNDQNKPVG